MLWTVTLQILRVPGGVSEQEEVQVQVTRLLVESYFDVVRKNLQDAVPKAVMHFLVNSVQRGLQQHLIHTLYRSPGTAALGAYQTLQFWHRSSKQTVTSLLRGM